MVFFDALQSTSTGKHVTSIFTLSLFGLFGITLGQTHQQVLDLHQAKLNNLTYNTDVRPLWNQANAINVSVRFSLLSIVDVDEVAQYFSCSAFFAISWIDEIIAWNPADYGNLTTITPKAKDIWRPRMILVDSLLESDQFKDEHTPLWVNHNGLVYWSPSMIFKVTCNLNLYKFPFDEQKCILRFVPMNHDSSQLILQAASDRAETIYATPSSEWDLTDTKVVATGDIWSSIEIYLNLRRRPYTFLLTLLLPVVMLSLLNFFVYVLPVESGEKVSYGVTVLLSQGVFMTTLTSILPPSTATLPNAIIYLFTILVISSVSVVCNIAVVWLYHKESIWNASSERADITNGNTMAMETQKGVLAPGISKKMSGKVSPLHNESESMAVPNTRCRKYSKGVNTAGFLVTAAAWLGATIWFWASILT